MGFWSTEVPSGSRDDVPAMSEVNEFLYDSTITRAGKNCKFIPA